MLAALKKTLGLVEKACDIAGISADEHFAWLKSDEKYKNACAAIDLKAQDFVKYYQKAKGEEETMASKGKKLVIGFSSFELLK